ncbi:hypothetical protein GCM10009767_12840 [Kocuria aegyptia]|uniref:Uncharacterized protein n=1 Tax=Kocuria aegyptia TaxID=330943 RepID=A0ABN2KFP5_9MICC
MSGAAAGVAGPVVESAAERTAEPAGDPAAEAVAAPSAGPADDPAAEAADEAADESAAGSTVEPAAGIPSAREAPSRCAAMGAHGTVLGGRPWDSVMTAAPSARRDGGPPARRTGPENRC